MTVMDPHPQPRVVATGAHRCDAVDLFLFSAACWLPHRLHYDAQFAETEGMSALPVHGPLQASWLSSLVDQWARAQGGVLVEMSARNVSPAYVEDALEAQVAIDRTESDETGTIVLLRLTVMRDDGTYTTTGSAKVRFSGAAALTNQVA
jgi:hydroxyacyl-ACP dehydratase HTD2-like protein with hotdog domain